MVKYKILNRNAELLVSISGQDENYVAKIVGDNVYNDVQITGKDTEDVYMNCRSWASSNIKGEFSFEAISTVSTTA